MAVKPKFEYFTKPRHPRHNWDGLNAQKKAAAEARAIDFYSKHWERRARSGFVSLKECCTHRVMFARVPLRDRPAALAELNRMTNLYIARTGHHPSPQKRASLIANATRWALYVLTGEHAKKIRAYNNRKKVWRRLKHEQSQQLVAESGVAPAISKGRRSSYHLPGV